MVKTDKLTKEQREALEKADDYSIAGPCSLPTINTIKIAEMAKQIRVEIKKP